MGAVKAIAHLTLDCSLFFVMAISPSILYTFSSPSKSDSFDSLVLPFIAPIIKKFCPGYLGVPLHPLLLVPQTSLIIQAFDYKAEFCVIYYIMRLFFMIILCIQVLTHLSDSIRPSGPQ